MDDNRSEAVQSARVKLPRFTKCEHCGLKTRITGKRPTEDPVDERVRTFFGGTTIKERLLRMILLMEAYFLARFILQEEDSFGLPGQIARVTRVRVIGKSDHGRKWK